MSHLKWLMVGCVAILVPAGVLSQMPSGATRPSGRGPRGQIPGARGGRPRRGDPTGRPQSPPSDPNAIFNMLSKGKDVIVSDDLDERGRMIFDRIAKRLNVTGDRITRDQFAKS